MTALVPGPVPKINTVPVVAHAGERVLTPEQMEQLRRGGGLR